MPLKLEIRDRAIVDLEKIAAYIAKQNRDAIIAERFARRVLDRCAELINAPKMGSSYHQQTGVWKINEGAYKILYRLTDKKVVVLRIWDGRRRSGPRTL
jgi:plasmid stabilization system protein ParE